jgi:hypothetical protein
MIGVLKWFCLTDRVCAGMDLPFTAKVDAGGHLTKWRDERLQLKPKMRRYGESAGGVVVQFGACKECALAQDTNRLTSDGKSTGMATFMFTRACTRIMLEGGSLTCAAA